MTSAPDHRSFRYSLRTLFVAVTLLAGWLSYHLNWIQKRHNVVSRPNVAAEVSMEQPAPFPLRMLGESGYSVIAVSFYDDKRANVDPSSAAFMQTFESRLMINERHEVKRIRGLFPEATVLPVIAPKSEQPLDR